MSIELAANRTTPVLVDLPASAAVDTQPAASLPVQDITSEGCGFQDLVYAILSALSMLIGSLMCCFTTSETRPANDNCESLFSSLMRHESLKALADQNPATKWNCVLTEALNNPEQYLTREENAYTLFGLSGTVTTDAKERARKTWLGQELASIVQNFPVNNTGTFHFVSYEDPGLINCLFNVLDLIEVGYAKIDIDIIGADQARFSTFKTLVSNAASEKRVEVSISNYATVEAHVTGAADGVHLINALELTDLQSHKNNIFNLKTKLHENGGLLVSSEKLTAVFLREGMKCKMPA